MPGRHLISSQRLFPTSCFSLSFLPLPVLHFHRLLLSPVLRSFCTNTCIITLNIAFCRGWSRAVKGFPLVPPQPWHTLTQARARSRSLSFNSVLFSNMLTRWMPSHMHLSAGAAVLYYLILTAGSLPLWRFTAADVPLQGQSGRGLCWTQSQSAKCAAPLEC